MKREIEIEPFSFIGKPSVVLEYNEVTNEFWIRFRSRDRIFAICIDTPENIKFGYCKAWVSQEIREEVRRFRERIEKMSYIPNLKPLFERVQP